MTRNKQLTALVSCALLIAIEIVLSRFFSISTPIVRIGFDFAPMALAGILFGPWYGCAVGALADLLGANLFPAGPFWPGFTLVAGLSGLAYGLLLHHKAGAQWSRMATVLRIAAAVLIVILPLQLGLDTVNLMLLLDKGFFVLLPARITKAVVMIPVQFVTINALYRFVAVPSFRLAR
ncbi:MAG: folate family ECF transporter S component [Lawsonibacter sp.]|nr:folate family ECF transporter S component [Lawsonibacter sp.]